MQTNRKFSHVVRPSDDEPQRRPRFTQISDLVRKPRPPYELGQVNEGKQILLHQYLPRLVPPNPRQDRPENV